MNRRHARLSNRHMSRPARNPQRRIARLFCLAIPALIVAASITDMANNALFILYAIVGLGLVIFFHELGHFAVAKWCDVLVERFSIGFGPILWARKWGETEYALSAVPFGGYVKMLGQDDTDPSQLTSDELAQDPRSYSAKPVWQRIAIISAGVTMNILTAVLFYAGAHGIGLTERQPIVGMVTAADPAWKAGIRVGDRIESMNGRQVLSDEDIIRGVVLSANDIEIKGRHSDGTPFNVMVTPDVSGTRRQIGVGYSASTMVADLEEGISPVLAGSPASKAEPPLKSGDRILAVNGESVETYKQLSEAFARHRAETITLDVERKAESKNASPESVSIKIGPNPTRTLGIRVEMGRVVATVDESPAAKAGIQAGDQITKIDGQDVGGELDPMQLPYYFGEKAGENVQIELQRDSSEGAPTAKTVTVIPEDRPGWTEQPGSFGEPLSIPAIGIAYHLSPRILSVTPGSPAAKAGLKKSETIESIRLELPKSVELEPEQTKRSIEFPMVETKEGKTYQNYAVAFTAMQQYPRRNVYVKVSGRPKEIRVDTWSDPNDTWYLPTRGYRPHPLLQDVQAKGLGDALALGYRSTVNNVIDLYLTLRSLFTGRLSFKELRGPIGIAEIAYKISQNGFAELLKFLGYLSVNLAVLNFLPIPVLDGGHMVFLIWEGVTRRKPSERVVHVATMVGLAFILMLMLTAIYMDLIVHKVFRG